MLEAQTNEVQMNTQQGGADGFSGLMARMWLDGFDGQEDELEDVHKGKLDPPTDDEVPGEVVIRPNHDAIAQEEADEDDEEIEEDLETRTPG
jgi:hypothetical protein